MTKLGAIRVLLPILGLTLALWAYAGDEDGNDIAEEIAHKTALTLKDTWKVIKQHETAEVLANRILIAQKGKEILGRTVKKRKLELQKDKKNADDDRMERHQKELFSLKTAYGYWETRWAIYSGAADFLASNQCELTVGAPLVSGASQTVPITEADVRSRGDLLFGIERETGKVVPYDAFDAEKGFLSTDDGKDAMKKAIKEQNLKLRKDYSGLVEVIFLRPTQAAEDKETLPFTRETLTLSVGATIFQGSESKELPPLNYGAQTTSSQVTHVGNSALDSKGQMVEVLAVDCHESK